MILKDINNYTMVNDVKITQKLLLSIAVRFHEICEKHGLVYNLFAGSLLGAVRHKGFIPWDDDMDVCMLRSDYEKLVSIMKQQYSEEFKCMVPGDENYMHPFMKIFLPGTIIDWPHLKEEYNYFGLFLDVFPFDEFPDDDFNRTKLLYEIRALNSKIGYATKTKKVVDRQGLRKFLKLIDPVRNFKFAYHSMVGCKKYAVQYDCLQRRFNGCGSGNFTCYFSDQIAYCINRDKFLDRVLYDFEGYKFWSVRDYDWWLERKYGDYMIPKPPDSGDNFHGYKLYAGNEVLCRYCK